MQELEDQGGVDVLLGGGHDPHAALPGVEVAGPGDVGHRGAGGMASMDHAHSEGVNNRPAGE